MRKERDGRVSRKPINTQKQKEMFFLVPVSKSFSGVSPDPALWYQKGSCRHGPGGVCDIKMSLRLVDVGRISNRSLGTLISKAESARELNRPMWYHESNNLLTKRNI
ncbi:MAG: hypothetical protein VR65_04590 [Desulfobulbaceae bacterium BRH_c16a]|nr:MAG: hypothetical protein VR65_04590 [Desulfobulbaceae bacterium BRH_c16a]